MNNTVNELLVQTLDYSPVDLYQRYPNQALLLLFYNNQCLGCTGRALPMAYEFKKQFPNIQTVAIHSNFGHSVTEQEIKEIFTLDELPYPIFIDEKHKLYDFFKSEGTPQWILLTPQKKIFRSIFGSQMGAKNRLLYALEELEAIKSEP